MKISSYVLVLGLLFLSESESAVFGGADTKFVRITGASGLKIPPSTPSTKAQLFRDWGQFEVLLPKNSFPLPAPNCRGDIKLRFPAVVPSVPGRNALLEERWKLLLELHRIQRHGLGEMVVRLDLRHYVISAPSADIGSGQRIALRYCNAFAAE